MFGLEFLAGSIAASLFLGIIFHKNTKEKEISKSKPETTVELILEVNSEINVQADLRSKTIRHELQSIWYFFENYTNGHVRIEPSSDGVLLEDEQVRFYFNKGSYDVDYIYIWYESNRVFEINYNGKTKQFLSFKDGLNLLDEEDLPLFVGYFQAIVHSPNLSERQIDKTAFANRSATELETKTKTNIDQQPIESITHWEERVSSLKSDVIWDSLQETIKVLEAVQREKDKLGTEDAHRLERVQDSILPELLQSYVELSTEERVFQQKSMRASLEKVQKILNDLCAQARKEVVLTFEKNVERLNQFER